MTDETVQMFRYLQTSVVLFTLKCFELWAASRLVYPRYIKLHANCNLLYT